ncbi:ribose-phosphate pyrophosphokinase [Thoreauomyces humboldtii]|nr:ribose-phosphate pyrophosphokinase [Thoreauomyces humboldtii]
MRDITLLAGSSHPQLAASICQRLGVSVGNCTLSKFSNKETNVEVRESVREQDVYIIQSGCGNVNDNFMELLIMIAACKTASARKVTAVMPSFPYARQPETPYNRNGTPLSRVPPQDVGKYANLYDGQIEGRTITPLLSDPPSGGAKVFSSASSSGQSEMSPEDAATPAPAPVPTQRVITLEKSMSTLSFPDEYMEPDESPQYTPKFRQLRAGSTFSLDQGGRLSSISRSVSNVAVTPLAPQPLDSGARPREAPTADQKGYKHWSARSGTLIANMLMAAGADHIITMDLHDPQFQGFFDIPVDNLHGQPLMIKYIKEKIPLYQQAVIVSPDAGGAKRATGIADRLNMDFALVHKERRVAAGSELILVGDVKDRVCILVDDIADTSFTITRAAALLTKSGATRICALITHGILSGDAVDRIRNSTIDEVVVSNSVPQQEHLDKCGGKLKVFDVAGVFAEAIRRIHNGESVSFLFEETPY